MAKLPEPETGIEHKIFNLYTELTQAENDKKETMKAHRDNIKRIKSEMEDLVEQEEDDVKKSQKSVD